MEKSKFFSMKTKKKNKEADLPESDVGGALTELEVNDLLSTVEESMKAISEAKNVPTIEEKIEVKPEPTLSVKRKAYNIYQDPTTRVYMMDIITYEGENVISFEHKKLTVSQPMAMFEIKKIFTDKLILKKGGV